MYIGLISDTHGVFDDEFRRFLDPVDCIWHAGDWGGDEEFTRRITSFKKVIGVHGNCDAQPVRWLFPAVQNFECEGLKVLMTHIGGSPGHYDYRAYALIDSIKPDIFVCGHSHILKVMRDKTNALMYINPGAAGLQGWQVVRTALRFRVGEGRISEMEVFELPRR